MNDAQRTKIHGQLDTRQASQAKRERARQLDLDAKPQAGIHRLASEHPLLLIVSGLAAGVAIATFIPKSSTRKFGRSAGKIVATIAQLGLNYGQQALHAANDASRVASRGKSRKIHDIKGFFADRISTLGLKFPKIRG